MLSQISVTDRTCLLHVTYVTRDVVLLMNKMLSKEDKVLIKVPGVEKGYAAKRIMTEFLNFQEETGRLLPNGEHFEHKL